DAKLARNKPQAAKAETSIKNANRIGDWVAGDPNWLDEIASLSTKAPPGQDLLLAELHTPPSTVPRASNLLLHALVKSTSVADRRYDALSDPQHVVRPKASDPDKKVGGYPLKIETEVEINPPKAASLPASKGGPASSSGASPASSKAGETSQKSNPESLAK